MQKRILWSVVAVGTMVLGGAAPAYAVPGPPTDWTSLTFEASTAGSSSPVVLGGDIAEPNQILQVGRTLTLDLNGNNLDLLSVKIAAATTLTITDSSAEQSGQLTADASSVVPTPPPFEYTPGINVSVGALVIDSGHVTATGGTMAAGIGGADLSATGPITINGGTVVATSGDAAAGIGGGNGGSASDITITGGDVTATSTLWGAGVGGGFTGSGGDIVVSGGTVTATGGARSAGIGDGSSTISNENSPIAGSDISISGGTVTATGGDYGAGIGGGFRGMDVTVGISGGTVFSVGGMGGAGIGSGQQSTVTTATGLTFTGGESTATGGSSAAAVGGGKSSVGGTTIVGPDAVLVTNSDGTPGATAFGAGASTTALSFGSVRIEGLVEIASGGLIIADSNTDGPEVVITATGRIHGPSGPGIPTLTFSGSGQIQNDGVIAADIAVPPCATVDCVPDPVPSVLGHDYTVTFDAGSGAETIVVSRLLAPTFDAAGWSLPAPPVLTQWSTMVDGVATAFTSSTLVEADTTVVPTAAGTVTISPVDAIATAGTATAFEVVVRDVEGTVVDPAAVTLTSSNTDDTIDGLTVTAATVGSRTITAAVNNGLLTAATNLNIKAAAAATLTLTSSSDSVDEGASLRFTVTAEDEFGNAVDASGAILTSSVATDVVDGLTVRFAHASNHVITATLDGASTSVTIQVKPTPVKPTPVEPTPVTPTPVEPTPVTPTPVKPIPVNPVPAAVPDDSLAATGPAAVGPLTGAALLLLLAGTALALTNAKLRRATASPLSLRREPNA